MVGAKAKSRMTRVLARTAAMAVVALLSACSDSSNAPVAATPVTTPAPAPAPIPAPAPAPAPEPPPPVTLVNVVLNPPNIGSQSRSEGTVILSGPAPAGGAFVLLSSSNRDAAKVPPSMVIPEGQPTGTFLIESSTVRDTVSLSIVASYNGDRNGATLTVAPQPLSAVIRINQGGQGSCILSAAGTLTVFGGQLCVFDASLSSGEAILYRWHIRTTNGTFQWQTTQPQSTAQTTCALMGGQLLSPSRTIDVEVGLQLDGRQGDRSELTTRIITVNARGVCGYP